MDLGEAVKYCLWYSSSQVHIQQVEEKDKNTILLMA